MSELYLAFYLLHINKLHDNFRIEGTFLPVTFSIVLKCQVPHSKNTVLGSRQMVFNKSNQKNKRSRIDIAAYMSPSLSDFKNELVPSAQGASSKDEIFYATKADPTKPIPQGGYACFIPSKSRQDTVSSRLNLLEKRMNQLEIESKALKLDTSNLKKDAKRHEIMHQKQAESLRTQAGEIKELKSENLMSISKELRNNIVQLYYALMHAKILQIIPEAETIFSDNYLISFDQVLEHPFVDAGAKARLKKDPTYLELKRLSTTFRVIRKIRNDEVHPNVQDLSRTAAIITKINNGKTFLTDIEKKLFLENEKLFNSFQKIGDFRILVELFNNRTNS